MKKEMNLKMSIALVLIMFSAAAVIVIWVIDTGNNLQVADCKVFMDSAKELGNNTNILNSRFFTYKFELCSAVLRVEEACDHYNTNHTKKLECDIAKDALRSVNS